LGIADIAALAAVAHEAGAILAVDNTFATPYSSSRWPWALTSSCTRPRSTAVATATSSECGRDGENCCGCGFEDAEERIAFHQNSMGAIAGPFDAWLVLRGLKTLGVRMDRPL